MPQRSSVAVVAEPSPAEGARVRQLLLGAGFAQVLVCEDGLEALRLVGERRPDALLASLTLRPADGVWLARSVLSRPLPVRPAIVLTRVAGLMVPDRDWLDSCGVAVVEKPVGDEALREALARTQLCLRPLPLCVRRRRDDLFDRLGLPAHDGRRFLETAVGYVWQDARLLRSLTGSLYPMVAHRHGVSARKVEQSMRYAIESAWKTGRIDEQYSIFRGTIDAQRGKPTCGEMIAQLADILRLEEVRE